MKIKNIFMPASVSMSLLLLAACGALNSSPTVTPFVPTPTLQPVVSVEYSFVTNQLLIPTTLAQSQAFALNVDGDLQGRNDNLFGTLLSLLTSAAPSLNLQSTLDEAINAGEVVTLHVVKGETSLNDSSVLWNVFAGEKPQTAPKFDGSDNFTINPDLSANLPIAGSLTNGHFTGGPGTMRIQMLLLGQLVDINLVGVRLDADISANGCANGKIGGGVTVEEFQGKLLPSITDGLNQVIKIDKAIAATLLPAFDADQNGTITIQEVENNPLLMIAASPDLDLLDASGNFNPNQDGEKDSYSMGLGFTCVAATFTVPGE